MIKESCGEKKERVWKTRQEEMDGQQKKETGVGADGKSDRKKRGEMTWWGQG